MATSRSFVDSEDLFSTRTADHFESNSRDTDSENEKSDWTSACAQQNLEEFSDDNSDLTVVYTST